MLPGVTKGVLRPMNRLKCMFLIMALGLVTVSGSARADCWAVFSESYRSFYYKATGISLPSRTGNFSSPEECESALDDIRSNPDYRYDVGLGQTRCECASASGSVPSSSGGSFEQQLMTTAVSSFLNLLLSGFQTDPGAAGEAQRQALQKKWEKEEEERRLAEKKRQDAAFANAQAGALGLLGNRPGVQKPTPGDGVNTGDGLKPGGTSFFGLGGGPGSGTTSQPMNDPIVVDLRHLRRASYFAQAVETASTEDVGLLLDEALKVANGAQSSLGTVPAGASLPEIDDRGLLAFQQANSDYAKAHDWRLKSAEDLKAAQQRRELAYRTAATRRAEVQKQMAGKTDEASLNKKQELLAAIDAALQAEDAAWRKAKAQLVAAEDQADKTREESVRVLRALALGKDPAGFHPPIASLPALKEETWQEMQKSLLEERQKLAEQTNKLQKQLAAVVPPLKSPEHVHEGVILGFGTDADDALKMQKDGVSPFMEQSYSARIALAEQARAEGKEIGGAMVVSFGTPEQKEKYLKIAKEGTRVGLDNLTEGEFSLTTPQGQAAVKQLAGKEFDRLVAHSNGASIAEALIRDDVITVNELNIVGGDRSLLNGHAFQELLDSGKVKRVVVWINLNDPVPSATCLTQFKPVERSKDAVEHLAKKITGDLAGGDSAVEYRFMWGIDYRNISTGKDDSGFNIKKTIMFDYHLIESSYFPGIANYLGVKPGTSYILPKRVLDEK
jgi:hypothetical protein